MARGRKRVNLTVDEQIKQLEEKIKSGQEELTIMKAELSKLYDAKKLEEIARLYDAVMASGRTVEDIITQLNDGGKKSD